MFLTYAILLEYHKNGVNVPETEHNKYSYSP